MPLWCEFRVLPQKKSPGDPGRGPAGQALARLAAATASLVAGLDGLGEAEARGASRLPGRTRGHVRTHLARDAEGGTRRLTWARTGIPGHAYESVTPRAAAIEAGAGRPARVLAADVPAAADDLATAAAAVPDHAWDRRRHHGPEATPARPPRSR